VRSSDKGGGVTLTHIAGSAWRTPVGNIGKDFWVCWTLITLYHRLPKGGPRLLFKGGTSLSKAYGLIQRFSEDIDVIVFRDDIDQAASIKDLQALSGKKRTARLGAIRDACRAYIADDLMAALAGGRYPKCGSYRARRR
jgi:hypothetical protein